MEILLIIGAGLLVGGYILYVRVIGLRNRTLEALSCIDVQLKKRANLVPNVLALAKKFMEHERGLLESVTAARVGFEQDYDTANPEAVKKHLEAAGGMQASLSKIMAVAENYPELKSDSVMIEAQRTYQDVEANIAAARRFYNAAVTSQNNAVEIFPSSLIATRLGIKLMPYYEADKASRALQNAADLS